MSVNPMREIVIEAALNDPYDGVIRLLGDAQRFGFELRALTLEARTGSIASATITLGINAAVDAQLVASRLARHPAVLNVDARGAMADISTTCPKSLAA